MARWVTARRDTKSTTIATGNDDNIVNGNGATVSEVSNDGDCVTSDDNYNDDDGDNDGNGNGVMGSGAMGYDDDNDGNGRHR